MTAQNDEPGFDESKTGAYGSGNQSEAIGLRQFPCPENFREPAYFRIGLTGDQDAIRRSDYIEFIASTRLTLPLKRSTDSMRRWTDGLDRLPGHGRDGDVRELQQLREHAVRREQPDRIGNTFQEEFALFLKLARLHDRDPGFGRKIIAKMRPQRTRRGSVPVWSGVCGENAGLRAFSQAALSLRGELPNRIDVIAEELDAVR